VPLLDSELTKSIGLLERRYFAEEANGDVDLRSMAENWLRQTA